MNPAFVVDSLSALLAFRLVKNLCLTTSSAQRDHEMRPFDCLRLLYLTSDFAGEELAGMPKRNTLRRRERSPEGLHRLEAEPPHSVTLTSIALVLSSSDEVPLWMLVMIGLP